MGDVIAVTTTRRFIFIVENTNQGNNTFIGTYDHISKEVGVCRQTIARIMKKLQANNFIKKVQNGVWLVNPNILMKGNDTKRRILLSYYESEEPISEISMSRTKELHYQTQIHNNNHNQIWRRINMNNNLELIYWTNNGGVKLPLEDWQYKVIAQVLGLSIQEDKNGNIKHLAISLKILL